MTARMPPSLDDLLGGFPRDRRWLLPALQAVQHARGYLGEDALGAVSARLRVPASEVYAVATDYPELRLHPHGQHHVRVCTGVSCRLLGGRELLTALQARLLTSPHGALPADVIPGSSHSDGAAMTVEAADCFFECSVAPLIEVDGAYRGRVTFSDVARIEEWFGSTPTEAPAGIFPEPPIEEREGREASGGASVATGPGASIADGAGAHPSHRGAARASAEAALARLVDAARERRRASPSLAIRVQMGACGRAVGAEAVLGAVRAAVAAQGVAADVVEGACNGMCYAAPLVEVDRDGGPRVVLEHVTPAIVPALVKPLTDDAASFDAVPVKGLAWPDAPWRGLESAAHHPFWAGQERVLLRRAGAIDPGSLDAALVAGAYRALARALDGSPEQVIAEVKAAGLQGRGGAFFPAAVKWEACRNAAGSPKYLVMNGEEGEPGIFKDRHLMEGDPHLVLEGVLLAAWAAGATHAILYVHGEANLSAARLATAVRAAAAAGIVGPRMLGSDAGCTVELRRGAGGFVLGEETALLESMEGRRAQPRTRPPFPVESGLWGKPTVINNVETLASVPAILLDGAPRFTALGTPKAPGTKVFGLSGPLRRPGVVEVRNGVTLRALLETIGGGHFDGRPLLGAVVGGPSGSIVPAALFDVPMEPRGQVSPGTGGIVALPEGASVVDVVRTLLAFNAAESCGKCTPCREGAPRLLALIDALRGATSAERVEARVRELAEAMQLASLCGLGQAAPLALVRALDDFGPEFRPPPA